VSFPRSIRSLRGTWPHSGSREIVVCVRGPIPRRAEGTHHAWSHNDLPSCLDQWILNPRDGDDTESPNFQGDAFGQMVSAQRGPETSGASGETIFVAGRSAICYRDDPYRDVIWLSPAASARRFASRRTGQIAIPVIPLQKTTPNLRMKSEPYQTKPDTCIPKLKAIMLKKMQDHRNVDALFLAV
jgi:hypothetical protein